VPVRVRSDLSVPLGTQLFWQIRYAIATGEYVPGERLPTVREMAAALRVNANTIRAVYSRLQDEGWVVARRKVGTVVTDAPPRSHDAALELILGQAFAEAAAHGISSEELAAGAFARAAQGAATRARHLLFVECGRQEAEALAGQLAKTLGDEVDEVESCTINEVSDHLAADPTIDAVVTTVHHAEEVRPLASHLPVVSLMPSSEYLGSVAEITRMRPGTRVGVPGPCRTPRKNVAATIRRLGHGLEVIEADRGDDAAIATCDVVVAWTDEVLATLPPGARVLPWAGQIDPAGIAHLRRQLAL
jgi:DNA-binding transcriptional regulator YhcF (GntR family)